MAVFEYGPDAIAHLKSRDKRLAEAIERIGCIERKVTPDLFTALVMSVVSQQISAKAADTVGRRLAEAFPIEPAALASADVEAIQRCGLSMRKASYIHGIATAVASGALDLATLPDMTDDELVATLSALPGIGRWTAEMLMIFSLCRPDVVAWDDLAIRRGMMMLYHHRKLTRTQFDRYRKRYAPHGSVASLYLWAISAGE